MLARTTKTLDPVRPSAAIQANYQRRLDTLIVAMAGDTQRQLARTFKAKGPELAVYALDASPARVLSGMVDQLTRKWSKRIGDTAPALAKWFADKVEDRSRRQLKQILAKSGMTAKFRMTAAMNDAYQAVIAENVGLIKSIPERYFAQVRTLTMQSVSQGRDLAHLAKGLEQQLGVTRRRAAFISRDQNNRATAVMTNARYLEMGITKAIWQHSAGGKEPRPEHVAFSGHEYDLREGHDFHNGEGVVWPGTAIQCRCVARAVVPGLQ